MSASSSILTLLTVALLLFVVCFFEFKCQIIINDTFYDFIIIGAGSGGAVLANRLSENPNWTILLIEAGRDASFLTDIPLTSSLLSITDYNWGFKSEKIMHQQACVGLKKQRCNLVRGKALGGTSVLNFLLYTRGHAHDFNEWAEKYGNAGWDYDAVLPYFKKSENCTICENIDRNYHGNTGELHIEHAHFDTPLVDAFFDAGKELNYPVNNDPNGENLLGFSKVQATMRRGRRCSAATAFLSQEMRQRRKNLKILTQAQATKILINPATMLAYGVDFRYKRRMRTAFSRKEVLVCAGTINSPQLLMLSGIGPKRHLDSLGIKTILDLPAVGMNFQDHMAMSTLTFLVNKSAHTVSDLNVQNPMDVFNFLINGKGPYTIPGGALALAFMKTNLTSASARSDDTYPDIELVLGAGGLNGDLIGGFRNLLGLPDQIFEQVYRPVSQHAAFSIAPVLLRPKSRGRVYLADTNPFHFPKIQPNYYADDNDDLATMVEGVKLAVKIAESAAFKRFNSTLNPLKFPQCKKFTFSSDAYWSCAIRHFSTTLGHHVGTCKMGLKTDRTTVVNRNLQVHGVDNLRVVDGSVMPNIIAGHTNAVIIMIGEKASDLIKKLWEKFET